MRELNICRYADVREHTEYSVEVGDEVYAQIKARLDEGDYEGADKILEPYLIEAGPYFTETSGAEGDRDLFLDVTDEEGDDEDHPTDR